MAKMKKAAEQQPTYFTLPDIGPKDEPDASAKKADTQDTATELAALREQIAELNRYKADNERLQSANLALMQQPMVQTQPQMLPTEPDMKGLPDPVEKPQEYAVEVAKRTSTAIKNAQANNAAVAETQQSAQQKLQTLWTDFNAEYGQYADKPQLVKFAATEVANAAAARGLDVGRYMFANSKGFMADVVKYIETNFPQKAAEDETADDEAEDTRTVGMFGGFEGRNRPTTVEDPGKSSTQQVQDWQAKYGWHS